MKLPRTRKAAKKAGLPFYFTGKPCKHGHLSPRKVVNWTCHKCAKKSNMVWLKGNLCPRNSGLAYRLMNVLVQQPGTERKEFYSQVCFEKEPVQLTASELLAPRPQKSGRTRKQTDASEWLESFLSEGPVDSKIVYEEGKELGYSQRTLERVKKSMGILAIPIRNKVNDLVLRWEWRLKSS